MARSFRDRFYTPRVARAIMSPLGIVLFGAVTAGAVLVGAPLALAAGAGVLAWGGNVARSVPRDARPHQADTTRLGEPWKTYASDAEDAKRRFDDVVATMTPGPLRDRLAELANRLDDGVAESGRIATRGNALTAAAGRIDEAGAQAKLAELTAQHAGRDLSATTAETMRSLEAQIATDRRIKSAAEQADARLRRLDAWLDELVARAVEVSLGTADEPGLESEVDDLVTELEALRRALDETDRAAGATGLATG
jgi:hypothetical protein